VSQFLIRDVLYTGSQDPKEVVFRSLLFRLFNRVSTWQLLTSHFGQLTYKNADFAAYDAVLSKAFANKQRLYSAAYIIATPAFGQERRHSNHVQLLRYMMETRVHEQLMHATGMEHAFQVLLQYPSIGNFLAYQLLLDINYSNVIDFDENEFSMPGPGARDGIRKCFGAVPRGIEDQILQYMVDTQDEHFARLGLTFNGLNGRRLHLTDCENLFCETDKYARMAHPEIAGLSGRTRIKQKYTPDPKPLQAWFPPKWRINTI
jgi:hypothetical protein